MLLVGYRQAQSICSAAAMGPGTLKMGGAPGNLGAWELHRESMAKRMGDVVPTVWIEHFSFGGDVPKMHNDYLVRSPYLKIVWIHDDTCICDEFI